jgi:hypothetical protein
MRLFLCPIHFFTSLSLIPVSGGVSESELPVPLTHAPRSRGLQTGEWRSLRAGRPLSRGEDAVPDGCIDPSIGSPNVTPFGDNRPTYRTPCPPPQALPRREPPRSAAAMAATTRLPACLSLLLLLLLLPLLMPTTCLPIILPIDLCHSGGGVMT